MADVVTGLVAMPEITDGAVRRAAVERARSRGIVLPTFAELAGQAPIPAKVEARLADVDPDAPHAENLWRVHWYNGPDRRGRVDVPAHVVLPQALTGVRAPIVVLLGSRFPMIGAHKVLPAYAGLVTRLVTGQFDPDQNRAVWPSTGNYCRGGVAISRILGCDGIAVLPEGMSRERYDWLERWVADPSHIIRTPGTESNVKEIYDKCHELAASDDNVILNQFSAFSNYMAHYACTGAACDRVFTDVQAKHTDARLAAFVSATGSAGTIAAGDRLKQAHGTRIAAVEALECPTMLENGYGEHNIQGIGDKHIPLIHNVMNTDFVIAVSDRVSDKLNLLFNTPTGKAYLASRPDLDGDLVAAFAEIGISGLANIAAAIKLARYMDYGPDDVVMTIATDSARLYETEMQGAETKFYPGGFSSADAGGIFASCLAELSDEHVLELGQPGRRRVFNLGYYTWVEQQGVTVEDFDGRRQQSFWKDIAASVPAWDRLITEFNAEVGLN
ncbi:pyridoxal-phosphate dependent enzyme [Kaistia granuli]|uniref:pyridoxal-phosphate dependent enzyme n=1 Tax=Kaistia granuli TaxID=363259 RepID=UPI0003629B4D|nr:pyridoxal-phosphate dependent enzyme [Kaistia granuli]